MVRDLASIRRMERTVLPDNSLLSVLRNAIELRLRSPTGRDFHQSVLYRYLMTHGLQHVFPTDPSESRLRRLVRITCAPPTVLLEQEVRETCCCICRRQQPCFAVRMVGEPTVYRVGRRCLQRLTAAGRLLHLARFFVGVAHVTEENANTIEGELARIVVDSV